MTNKDKEEIAVLRRQGLGYKKIAAQLDIPVSTVKSYCIRHGIPAGEFKQCIQCGMPLTKEKTGKAEKFCSIKCKNDYWNSHPKKEHKCKCCGRTYISPRNKSKFCSHECYIKFRFGGQVDE